MSPDTQYKTDISIEYGELKPVIDWCERNCVNDWGYSCRTPAGRDMGYYNFYFETESDYINFILWKK